MAKKKTKTDKAPAAAVQRVSAATGGGEIIIEGLRQNNLKDLSLRIQHDRITALVGPSGSGKSSVAFDTLFAEGRWRFIESLSTYTRLFLERMDRPDLDLIRNIRPAIAVEQKNPVRGSRSTVGTTTEINDYLRLLFARVGKLHCPRCDRPVASWDPPGAAEKLLAEYPGLAAALGFDLKTKGISAAELSEELLKKGFIRVECEGRLYDLSSETLPETLPESISVYADRLVIKESARERITEAVETSFREGAGAAWAVAGDGARRDFSNEIRCQECGTKVERPTPVALSFNHPVGACPECKGFGNVLKYDEDKLIPNRDLTLRDGAVEPWTKPSYGWWYEELIKCAPEAGIDLDRPFSKLSAKQRQVVYEGYGEFEGINGFCAYLESKKYKLHIKVFISRYKGQVLCSVCKGARLRDAALSAKINGLNIHEVSGFSIREARAFFKGLNLTPFEKKVSKELIKQLAVKLDFLCGTGLGYITLDRLTKTLSGGEAQRVTIATQLASSLCGVLYILDEPSIGLHPVDVEMLTKQLKRLCSMGNTVVTVEHDPSVIEAADHIIELGPGAGDRGGRVVYEGPIDDFLKNSKTLTSDYLTGRQVIHVPRWRRNGSGKSLIIRGASGNNLKDIELKIPLKTLTCVTGVSGSGKSTLVVDTLYNAVAAHFGEKAEKPLPYNYIEGTGNLSGVKLVDQGPIGRTPRSNPLTYIGGFDHIRQIFASLPAARMAGLTPGHFSFNVPGGRCEECKGEGVEKLEMYFLPDVYIKCAACGGKRYRPGVLDIKLRRKNIFDILNMTFEEAAALLPGVVDIQKKFSILKEVGLGYLKLGQSATTLSGGEAQRLKVARELVDDSGADMLYILDEPTTGLHMDDTKKLLSVLGRLVDSGNTVVLIEHNLDCIKTADHIIDLGPGAGSCGGSIVASGTPEDIATAPRSTTGKYLKDLLL